MKAAVAPPLRTSATSSALAARIAGGIGADGALDRFQRAVFLLRRGKRQHPRGGARVGGKLGHQGGQIGVAVDRLQRRAHSGSLVN